MAMLTQKQETKTIHPPERKEILSPKLKLKEQWGEEPITHRTQNENDDYDQEPSDR